MFFCFPCEIDKVGLFLASACLLSVTLNFPDAVDLVNPNNSDSCYEDITLQNF